MKDENVKPATEFHSTSTIMIRQTRTLIIFLVVAGYILTFITAAWGTAHFTSLQIVTGAVRTSGN